MNFDQWFDSMMTHPHALAYNNPLGLPAEGDFRGAVKLGWDAALVSMKLEMDGRLRAIRASTGNPLFDAGTHDACEKIEAWLAKSTPHE